MKEIYLINEDSLFMTLGECLDVEKRQVVTVEFGDNSALYSDELSYGMLIGLAESLYTEADPDSSYDMSIAGCSLEDYRRNFLFIALMKAFDDFIFEEEFEIIGQMIKETYQEVYNTSLGEMSNRSLVVDSINDLLDSEKIAKYALVKETNGY